jgi:hemolysin III
LASGQQIAASTARPYFRPEDIAADRWIHLAGLVLGSIATLVLLVLAGRSGRLSMVIACWVYATTLTAMLICSTLFHHGPIRAERRLLRRLDHAAIFMLIAGTYTPFSTCLLHGLWAFGTTAAVWAVAVGGALVKLVRPLGPPGSSTAGYLAVSGVALVGLSPILGVIDPLSLALIVAGLAIYAAGAVIRRRRALRYRNTLWHTMVLVAASCHFAAIMHGVVLTAR